MRLIGFALFGLLWSVVSVFHAADNPECGCCRLHPEPGYCVQRRGDCCKR